MGNRTKGLLSSAVTVLGATRHGLMRMNRHHGDGASDEGEGQGGQGDDLRRHCDRGHKISTLADPGRLGGAGGRRSVARLLKRGPGPAHRRQLAKLPDLLQKDAGE